jgi:hypothetical protein
MVRILYARITPLGETLIILANQPRQPGTQGIDQGMDPVPVGSCGHLIEVGFQNGPVGGRGGDVRTPPGCEQGERVVDQPALVLGRRAGVECVVLADHNVRALKAGLNLVRQPLFDASDIILTMSH